MSGVRHGRDLKDVVERRSHQSRVMVRASCDFTAIAQTDMIVRRFGEMQNGTGMKVGSDHV